jgi:hypothetical protein
MIKYEVTLPLVWVQISFIYSLSVEEKSYIKNINEIGINMQMNDITWKIMILQKIRKKNQWIWNYYDWETQVSNFNYWLKNDGENELSMRHVVPAKQLDHSSAATWSRSSIACIWSKLWSWIWTTLPCLRGFFQFY